MLRTVKCLSALVCSSLSSNSSISFIISHYSYNNHNCDNTRSLSTLLVLPLLRERETC